MMGPRTISKVLSPNDVGETGGHQAGFLIPKIGDALHFFPELDSSIKNPRHPIFIYDDFGGRWELSFIYYNNKFFGGTRNEYRLTGLTKFFAQNRLVSGDTIILTKDEDDRYLIHYKRSAGLNIETVTNKDGTITKRLKVSDAWKIIEYK